MDPEIVRIGTELLKHVPGAVEAVGAVVGSVKFTEITKAMLGPAANEVAERIHDEVRLYRFGRQLEMLKKAEKMAKDAGFTPKAVPVKLLFPLLEGASLEENESLHDMWAALLANASSQESSESVRPGFIAILKQMAADEAALLKEIEEATDGHAEILRPIRAQSKPALDRAIAVHNINHMTRLRDGFKRLGEEEATTDSRFRVCTQMLGNLGLIDDGDIILVTELGRIFLTACRPPKPKP